MVKIETAFYNSVRNCSASYVLNLGLIAAEFFANSCMTLIV